MSEASIQQTVSGDRNIFAGGDVNVVYNLPPVEADTRRNLLILLDKVKRDWVEGVLEQSILHEAVVQLGKEARPEMVDHPWAGVQELSEQGAAAIPPEQKIGDVFEKMGRTLLILGEPGSGKTITLLELARELIGRAQDDPMQPIPVVFNLSSWTEKSSFQDWLMGELCAKYQIPRRFSGPWLENQRLLLLLDGVDEVEPRQQAACVKALNAFVADLGVPGLAVCSRLQEYAALPVYLKLRGAICLQALSPDQVNDYLAEAGPNLAALREVVQTDPVLQELARTPLMLSVMSLAYHDLPAAALTQGEFDSPEKRRHHLFDTYIDRMLQRQPQAAQPDDRHHLVGWLAWLADRMAANSKAIFLIEELQPSWLASRKQLMACMLGYFLIIGLFWGLLTGLQQGVDKGVLAGSISGLTLTLSFCLVFGLIFGITSKKGNRAGSARAVADPGRRWADAFESGLYWSLFGLVWGLSAWKLSGLGGLERDFSTVETKVILCLIIGLSLSFFGRRNLIRGDIQTVEALGWSWAGAWRGSVAGIIFGLFCGTIASLYMFGEMIWTDLTFGARQLLFSGKVYAVLFGVIVTFFGGLKTKIIAKKTSPNQGVMLTIKSALVGGVGMWLMAFLVGSLFSGASHMLLEGLTQGFSLGLRKEFAFILSFSLLLGLLPGLSFYGGLDVVKHYVLRLMLVLKGHTPLNYARFLDNAVKLVFVRRVGGGYLFIHRQLQDHFAALSVPRETEGIPAMPLPEPQPLPTAGEPSRKPALARLLLVVGFLAVLGVAGGIRRWYQPEPAVSSFKTLELNKKKGEAYSIRGLFYAIRSQHHLAIADFTKALELNPQEQQTYYQRGLAYGKKGQDDLAIADFTKAIELDPKDQKAYVYRGLFFSIKSQEDLAIADFTKAIELNPQDGNAYSYRGSSSVRKGQYDLAMADLTRALELNPKNQQAYIERGVSHGIKRQHDLAIADFTKAIEFNPKNYLAYFNRGLAYAQKGQYDPAMADATKAIELNPKDQKAYFTRSFAYLQKGLPDLAIADATKVIELNPQGEKGYLYRSSLYARKGRLDLAVADSNKVIELNPKGEQGYIHRSEFYARQGQPDLAIADSTKAIELNPGSAVAYNGRGLVFLLIGKYDEAARDLKKSLELNPDLPYAIVSMAEFYAVTGKTDDACTWLEKGIQKGYQDWNYIKISKTFDNIRNSSGYQEIMKGR